MESSSLDRLAQAGIINFDADAYVKGTAPRFVGKPEGETYLPFDQPLTGFPMYGIPSSHNLSGEPSADAFVHRENGHGSENKGIHIPLKEALTAGLVGGLALFAGIKIKNAITKNKPELKEAGKKAEGFLKKAANSVVNFSKNIWKRVRGVFKPEANETKPKVELPKGLRDFLSKRWVKGLGIGALGLFGLWGISKLASGGNQQAQPQQHH